MSGTTVSPTDLFRHVHDALWADADRLRWAVAGLTPIDRVGRRGRLSALARRYDAYRVRLQAHHRVEDRVWFPAIAARSPEFVARDEAGLADDHRYLDALVGRADAALRRLADPAAPFEQARFDAESVVAALANLLADHFAQEERTAVPRLAEACSPDELADLRRRADREHARYCRLVAAAGPAGP